MAITRVQVVTDATASTVTSRATAALPTAATAGNLLVAAWGIDKSAGTVTPPPGWTVLASQVGTSISLLVAYKVAAGGDAAPTASWTTANSVSTVIAEYAGVNAASPIGPSHLPAYADTNRTSFALDPAAATSAGAALAFFAMDSMATAGDSTPFRPAATDFTWVATAVGSNAAVPGTALVENLAVTSGQDLAPTFTWTRSDQVAAFVVLLNAGTGTPPPTPGTLNTMWVGVPDGDSVPVTARTTGAASIRLKVGTNSAVTTGVVYSAAVTPDAAGYAQLAVDGLAPNTAYWCQVEVDGALNTTQTGSFRTDSPAAARSFRVAFGSCVANNSATSTVWDNLLANNPELFFHLGDWHYGNSVSTDPAVHRALFEGQLTASSGLRTTVRTVPTAYTPSDHDSGDDDWSGGPGPQTPAWNSAIRQLMPRLEALPTGGVYRSVHRGRVKFIITDGRSWKSLRTDVDGPNKTMFGATQEAWIASELADTAYPVKVLVMDVPWVASTSGAAGNWGDYRAAAQRLVDAIAAAGARVFVIHGDAHTLCADDGTSANNLGGIPTAGAAPLSNSTSLKGGPYSQGTWPTSGNIGPTERQHGLLDVTDDGGDTITVRFSGRGTDNVERVTMTKVFDLVPGRLDCLRVGEQLIDGARLGVTEVSRIYAGAAQVWP